MYQYIAKHGVHFHTYADDTQLYLDFSPEDEVSAHATIAGCVMEIKTWLSDNFLLLNENKTEAMTVMPVNQPAVANSIKLGDVTVPLSASVTNLGAVFDKKCRMEEHATRVEWSVGVQTIICTVFERLETALTSATPSC